MPNRNYFVVAYKLHRSLEIVELKAISGFTGSAAVVYRGIVERQRLGAVVIRHLAVSEDVGAVLAVDLLATDVDWIGLNLLYDNILGKAAIDPDGIVFECGSCGLHDFLTVEQLQLANVGEMLSLDDGILGHGQLLAVVVRADTVLHSRQTDATLDDNRALVQAIKVVGSTSQVERAVAVEGDGACIELKSSVCLTGRHGVGALDGDGERGAFTGGDHPLVGVGRWLIGKRSIIERQRVCRSIVIDCSGFKPGRTDVASGSHLHVAYSQVSPRRRCERHEH